jgi:beta-galactosidase GanA
MEFGHWIRTISALLAGVAVAVAAAGGQASASAPMGTADALSGLPTLRTQGDAVQLVVDGKPFLMLGGEVNNSSSSSLEYMSRIWTHMNDLHANTVLVPVSWEQIEPEEGRFDFSLVDGLLRDARRHGLRLVFLWLASWKNGMSSYQPLWVKAAYERFPRARHRDGTPMQVMSTLSENNWKADAAAFAALMAHVRESDQHDHTLLMVQVENEMGILGDSRDRSDAANAAFAGPVPEALMAHLIKYDAELTPEFRALWVAAGRKKSGTWEEVFGVGPKTDEIFMAWNYARYADHVTAAGKAEYPIPMYVNAWLNDPMDSPPGNYPSGCPESHVMDVWQAGAPHIDLLAPDLYAGNFEERCRLYTRRGNTLFIPEMNSDAGGAHNVFYAIGAHNALGTSPFGIDHTPADGPFSKSYDILGQIAPVLLAHQGKGETTGFVLDTDHPSVTCTMGDYELTISLDSVFGRTASLGYGVVVQTGPAAFLGAGSGFRVGFRPLTPGPKYAGIGTVEEGTFRSGHWVEGRRLNGDETDQGSGWRFSSFGTSVGTCTVYRYQ